MAILRAKDAKNMSHKERNEKLQELRFSLIRGKVTANKANAKTKETRKSIARLLTFNRTSMEVKKN